MDLPELEGSIYPLPVTSPPKRLKLSALEESLAHMRAELKELQRAVHEQR
jgi:hypothetical protein